MYSHFHTVHDQTYTRRYSKYGDGNAFVVRPLLPYVSQNAITYAYRFDIVSFGFKAEEDTAGMLQSSKSISELITAEISAGLDPSRIVLGGFSQGASMSFLTGLTIKEKLAGLVCLSGWLPLREKFLTSGVRIISIPFLFLLGLIMSRDVYVVHIAPCNITTHLCRSGSG